jgi:hypothetical protein
VYSEVPRSVQRYSRYNSTVIWNYDAHRHISESPTVIQYSDGSLPATQIDENKYLTPEYFKWRYAGFVNPYPVRYPVGRQHRRLCIGSIKSADLGKTNRLLTYIQARKEIYLPVYRKLVVQQAKFIKLKEMLERGQNLLIVEVDGPHQESLPYYMAKYNVGIDFIEEHTILATPENLSIMLNDSRHPFGHGYCLAIALLELEL